MSFDVQSIRQPIIRPLVVNEESAYRYIIHKSKQIRNLCIMAVFTAAVEHRSYLNRAKLWDLWPIWAIAYHCYFRNTEQSNE